MSTLGWHYAASVSLSWTPPPNGIHENASGCARTRRNFSGNPTPKISKKRTGELFVLIFLICNEIWASQKISLDLRTNHCPYLSTKNISLLLSPESKVSQLLQPTAEMPRSKPRKQP